MGGGTYCSVASNARAATYCDTSRFRSREEIFKVRKMDEELNIKNKIREACDSVEHPTSFPIIIAFDVTGSMGVIPEELIKGVFPKVMDQIMANGVEHAQVCFIGFGDHKCDDAPIQVGQFETSDELQDKWLTKVWLEGGGGGNYGESPNLVYYFASRHTKIDSFIHRKQKGVIITISDERIHPALDSYVVSDLFGDKLETSQITTTELINEVHQQWDTYHVVLDNWSSRSQGSFGQWKELLGENNVQQISECKQLAEIMPSMILRTYKKNSLGGNVDGGVFNETVKTTASSESAKDNEQIVDGNIML